MPKKSIRQALPETNRKMCVSDERQDAIFGKMPI